MGGALFVLRFSLFGVGERGSWGAGEALFVLRSSFFGVRGAGGGADPAGQEQVQLEHDDQEIEVVARFAPEEPSPPLLGIAEPRPERVSVEPEQIAEASRILRLQMRYLLGKELRMWKHLPRPGRKRKL